MKKQTPETDPSLANIEKEYIEADTKARETLFSKGLFEERTREFGGNVISVVDKSTGELVVSVQTVGDEEIASDMQEDTVFPSLEEYPSNGRHIDVEAKRSRATKVNVHVDNK